MAQSETARATSRDPEEVQPTVVVTRNSAPDLAALEVFTRHLPETDGVPLESPWHFASINLLIEVVRYLLRDRNDFFCGGNMFLYYSVRHVHNEEFKGPDFFYVNGVDRHRPREFWAVWEEDGKYPDLIIELLANCTVEAGRTTKKNLYEKTFRPPEYYSYDPYSRKLEGWSLANCRYQALVLNEHGWLWSEVLQLWLGECDGEYQGKQGTWLRFYDRQGQLVPTKTEAEQQRAATEHARAEAEIERAENARQQVESARQRAKAAQAELAKFKALLAQKGIVLVTPSKPS
jgi:Uma2 family endonuclease